MDQFNKALSFILGLVVVAVFIVVASGKFNLKNFSFPKAKISASISPTPTPIAVHPTPTPAVYSQYSSMSSTKPVVTVNPVYHSYSGSTAPTSIPNTGVPIVLFPLLGSSLAAGLFMKKSASEEKE